MPVRKLRPCISKDHGRICAPVLDAALTVRDQPDTISEAHYPNDARIVFPAASTLILLLQRRWRDNEPVAPRSASERRGWDHERAHPSR